MGTRFDPADWLARVLPKNFEKSGLLSENLSIKQRYLKALVRATSLSGKEITEEVYKMVDFYEKKEAELKAAGVRAYKQEALNDQALLKQRIKNMLVYTEVQEQRKAHKGQWYRWLPSNATTPDPEHALLYGKIFLEGTGDKQGNMPGERYGCQCGIEWLSEAEYEEPLTFQEEKVLEHISKKEREQIDALYENAVSRNYRTNKLVIDFGKLPKKSERIIKDKLGVDIKGFHLKMDGESVWHNHIGHGPREKERKQIPITKRNLPLALHISKKFDDVILESKKGGAKRLFLKKDLGNKYEAVLVIGIQKKHLLFKTFWGNK